MRVYRYQDFNEKMLNVAKYRRRDGVADILGFIDHHGFQRICGVIGLRRTGKTTMMLQAMIDLPEEKRDKAAYVDIDSGDDMVDLILLLKSAEDMGIDTFFVDEATEMADFLEKGATLPNGYGHLDIIVSGTHSFLLVLGSQSTLYRRMDKIRTTWMPWREYARVFRNDFESYLEYGGIADSGVLNEEDEKAEEYIRTAIVQNLVGSIEKADDEIFQHPLERLFDSGQIEDIVMRVLNSNTHKFIDKVLLKEPKLQELMTAFDFAKIGNRRFDRKAIMDGAKRHLGYSDNPRFGKKSHEIGKIEDWLTEMDVFVEQHIRFNDNGFIERDSEYMLSQPALRWRQALHIFDISMERLKLSETFDWTTRRTKDILSGGFRGELAEDVTLIDAEKTLGKNYEIFSWRFSPSRNGNIGIDRYGEFDMVLRPKTEPYERCWIFEVKNQAESKWSQARHLRHKPFLEYFDNYIGRIQSRAVLYTGGEFMGFDDVLWLNLPEFLENLSRFEEFMVEKRESLLEKRRAYDSHVAEWISKAVSNLDDRIRDYLDEREEEAMPFSTRLPGLPDPGLEHADSGADIRGVSWSALQSVLFDLKRDGRTADIDEIFDMAQAADEPAETDDPKP